MKRGLHSGRRAVLLFSALFTALCQPVAMPARAASATSSQTDREYFGIVQNIDLFGETCREVSANYVDTVDVGNLVQDGIRGMLSSLDPYSVFLDEEASKDIGELTTSQYAGVGIIISRIGQSVYVTSIIDGYAADRAGIRVGDRIVAVNGKPLDGLALEQVREVIRGNAGQPLSLRLEREGAGRFSRELVREEVLVSTVAHTFLFGTVGYIQLDSFGIRSGADVRAAFLELQQTASNEGRRLSGLVLDLRGNPGGLLEAAVDVSALFLVEGSPVVSIKGRSAGSERSFTTEGKPLDASLPMVILLDNLSASAAEILAGAVQDLDRGVVIGERSFGKGLVQTVIPLPYDNALKLTTARYYTPSGRLIQKDHAATFDSLAARSPKKAEIYHTRARRKVYGGGGITPDLAVSPPAPPPYLMALQRNGELFLFSRLYRGRHNALPEGEEGEKAFFEGFAEWLAKSDFSYRSMPQQRLSALRVSLEAGQGAEEEVRGDLLKRLEDEVRKAREREIAGAETEVHEALVDELLVLYGREAEAEKRRLERDPVFEKALSVLADPSRYRELLRP